MKVQLLIKRVIDFTVALTALIILMPFMILIACLVYLKLGSPIFFVHKRPGRYGKVFKMIKFRSLLDAADSIGRERSHAERLTPFGRIIRDTSLDELPELFNVLKGEMSLVGPRPLLVEYLPLYNEIQAKRHQVLPGITGWAQVNGRNTISWNEKFEYDVWYVENWSLLLDFKIIIKTLGKVFKKEGVNQSEILNMETWAGNDENMQS